MEKTTDAIAIEAIAKSFGFDVELTGGGCTALIRWFIGDVSIWITSPDGFETPTDEKYLIGVYNNEMDDLDAKFTGGGVVHFANALASAIRIAESHIPTTDALADELDNWCKDNGHFIQCADELRHKLLRDVSWLDDFSRRWKDVQSFEDMQNAAKYRGDI